MKTMNMTFKSMIVAAALVAAPVGQSLAEGEDMNARFSAAAAGEHRSDKNKARNKYRNPVETLSFFGIAPGMRVIEISPGGGWYQEVIAPAVRDQATYIAAGYDVNVPDQPKYRYRQQKAMLEKFEQQPNLYDQVEVVAYSPPQSRSLGEAESADMVVTFRNSHGWLRDGLIDDIYSDFFAVLKPGGILGVVQHRAPENDDAVAWAKKGYVSQAHLVAIAEKAGFELEASSEINANPLDLKDHERGVWRLPPSLSLGEEDREKYLAIGESDRMTLKFRKPAVE